MQKKLSEMQGGCDTPHGCHQRVIMIVENKDNGKQEAIGSPEWLRATAI